MSHKYKIMKLIELQTRQKNNRLLSFFLNLKKNIDQLGNEKIKILQLIWDVSKEAFSFEKYLDAAIILLNHVDKSFIETRSNELLLWLLEKLFNSRDIISSNSRCTLQTFRHTITFPFRTKEVLSFFIEIKNCSLDLDTLKKIILENYDGITFVDGSFISIVDQSDKTVKAYLELQKETIFSENEVSVFKNTIPQIITNFLSKPKVQLVVPSNRELLIKSFQWIIKDLKTKDLPHVFIDFSIQTASSFHFSALICSVREHKDASIRNKLSHQDIHVEYTNTLEEKKCLKEGVVLTIEIAATPSLSIIDARKKSYLLIQDLIGPFRDINGGLLEQIECNFNLFCSEINAPVEDLKSFFYGIVPQERQATAPIQLLKKAYISMNRKSSNNEIDYFVEEDKDTLCITVKTTHVEFEREFRHLLLSKFPETLIASTYTEGISVIGCILQKNDHKKNELLKNLTFSFYRHWREKKELKQVLKLGCTTEFSSFDPRIGTEEESSCLLKMLFEGLTKIGANGFPEKALAKKIEVLNSGLLYRFHLRKSYWSNETPVTAHDFYYSWETSLKPDFSSPLSYLFYPIKNAKAIKEGNMHSSSLGVRVVDDFTLEVELQYPCPYFLELCAHSAFSPICRSVDINNPSWPKSLGTSYICNGPFIADKINSKEIVLKKNFLFWEKKRVKLEKVIISSMTEEESLLLFQERKLDSLLYPFCKNKILKFQNLINLHQKKCTAEVRYFSFNCSKLPFSNKKIRVAFSLAIQRELLANSFSNKATPHYSPYSPEFSQLSLTKADEENQVLAKKLFFEGLAELKLNSEIFNKEYIYATPQSQGIEKLITKQLNNLFEINLRSSLVDASKLFSLIRKRKINIYIYAWMNRIQDPSYFLSSFSSPKNITNFPSWNNQKINYLNQLIQETFDLKNRKELHYQAENLLYQEKPIIPLLSISDYSLIQPNIYDIYVGNSQEFDIRYCYKK